MATKNATDKGQGVATAETNTTAVVPADYLSMMEEDAGHGVDNLGMDDVGVPYLYVLQTNSPQVNEDSDQYVKGARPGMFYNNVSGEVFDGRETGIEVIPCGYERKLVEWKDRDAGGGYVADHAIDGPVMSETTPDERGRPKLANGNLIVETAYHYVYMKNPHTGMWDEIVIPMKSTALKKSRRWNKSLMSTLIPGTTKQAPRWLYLYTLKTVKEQKDTNTWSNFDVTRTDQMVTQEQYVKARDFAKIVSQGAVVRAKESDLGGATVEGAGPTLAGDDDIPF